MTIQAEMPIGMVRADEDVLILAGAVDARTTEQVRERLYAALASLPKLLVVDLSAVTSIDLTALRMLAMATRRAHHVGSRVVLRGCGPAVRRLLHLSRISRCVEVERPAR